MSARFSDGYCSWGVRLQFSVRTSLVASRATAGRVGASGLGRGYRLDVALGSARGVLVDRLDGTLRRLIAVIVTCYEQSSG
jgi:hypothetical protein